MFGDTMRVKFGAIVVAAFVSGAFVSSPDLRAYAANTVFSTDIVDGEVKTADIANNAVTNAKIAGNAISTSKINDGAIKTADIGDGEVKASDISTDAVGADELQGVSKLQFTTCSANLSNSIIPGGSVVAECSIPGLIGSDHVLLEREAGASCFAVVDVLPHTAGATVIMRNVCTVSSTPSTVEFAAIVYSTS